ncbi:MerR family transcriptional regulator [Flexivirga caeni]|uniref:MerR family transcriptional regulator n=1 Tax=Flexivirga caeni TaxID=2294115 RepID=A0A3M9MCK5_9MICO|nr:MerR family transcriptional regulator [Flexivirga caeni]RNI22887.1 MerR family transcriptional regulator [Flexivirga caeni]
MDDMTAGEFGRKTGLSSKALRLYADSGLLLPRRIDERTGYRYYGLHQLLRAQRITMLRRAGAPLAVVRRIVDAPDDTLSAERLHEWWRQHERLRQEQQSIVEFLLADLTTHQVHRADIVVQSRTVTERTVASITRRVLQPDLVDCFSGDADRAISEHLAAHDATRTAEFWVIYHGMVSPDSDGPIEICVPFEGLVPPPRPRSACGSNPPASSCMPRSGPTCAAIHRSSRSTLRWRRPPTGSASPGQPVSATSAIGMAAPVSSTWPTLCSRWPETARTDNYFAKTTTTERNPVMNALDAVAVVDHSRHTAYSDPGRFGALLDAVPTDLDDVSAVARNLIVHYRASGHDLPAESVPDIHARWIERTLEIDQSRHPAPLSEPREPTTKVQGCCRDHTLLSVAILRQHGILARSRVGFVDYFVNGWHHDHVVPEVWLGERWVRFDPEVDAASAALADPRDITAGSGFHTAAEVWRAHRAGTIDVETYGVDPSVPVARGAWFVRDYVVREVAHRFGDELLLWDNWGCMGGPGSNAQDAQLIDEVAGLLVRADTGDLAAERQLLDLYRADERLHPGDVVLRMDLPGEDLVAEPIAGAPYAGGAKNSRAMLSGSRNEMPEP